MGRAGLRLIARTMEIMGNTLKPTALLGLLSGLFLIIGQMLGGQQGLVLAFVMAAVMNFGSYWFSDKIVLRMYRAKEVGPEHPLHQLTADLARRASLPMPRVYVIPDASPNAFATGRNPQHAAVAATEGIMRALDRDELAGVMAHELAHVRNRDILISSVAATIAAAIMMLARIAQFGAMFGGGRSDDREGASPIGLLVAVFVAPLAPMQIQAAISRSREIVDDATGAQIAGSPHGLASALRKIEAYGKQIPLDANPATAHRIIMKPFSMRGLFSMFSTHPPTEARIAALLGRGAV